MKQSWFINRKETYVKMYACSIRPKKSCLNRIKEMIFVLVMSLCATTNIRAQIPNNGFEVWEDYIDNLDGCKPPFNVYQKPDFWVGALPNKCEIHSFSIEKANESYPAGTGNFCAKIKADLANGVRGVIISNDNADTMKNWIPEPAFAINRKPASLFLYYKYLPYGGDTAVVQVYFYKNGQVIANTSWGSPETVTNWTPLKITLSYTNTDIPDSATILITTGAYVQHSETALWVDNLSFDGFVNSIPQTDSTPIVIFSQNKEGLTMTRADKWGEDIELRIYSVSATLTHFIKIKSGIGDKTIRQLDKGVYIIKMSCGSKISYKKILIY